MFNKVQISLVSFALAILFSGCFGSLQPEKEKGNDELINSSVKTVVSNIMSSDALGKNPVEEKIEEAVEEQCGKVVGKLNLNVMVNKAVVYGCVKYAVPKIQEELKKQITTTSTK